MCGIAGIYGRGSGDCAAFQSLPRLLKRGGGLVVDVYQKYGLLKQMLNTRYLVRPLTRNMRSERLHPLCRRYVRTMWPLTRVLHRIPRLGRRLVSTLLIPDYQGVLDLPETTRCERAELGLFDPLSPAYDQPQWVETVRRWFEEAGLNDINVCRGYNGVQGRATVA